MVQYFRKLICFLAAYLRAIYKIIIYSLVPKKNSQAIHLNKLTVTSETIDIVPLIARPTVRPTATTTAQPKQKRNQAAKNKASKHAKKS